MNKQKLTGARYRKNPPAKGSLGARLYEVRLSRDLSLEALAGIGRIDRTTLNRWELNTYTPKDFMAFVHVAHALQVSIAYLIGLSNEWGAFEWPTDYSRKFIWGK